ncbi:hypothetical protein [Massilia aquatica]|uniref:Uncharacterized protein n=1 Tax=Massilia aquatica TaxID=2609000 RepID=A0ABX0M6Z5_9BURK|nr:hypothetical protein [Massilia aquatica]NHZ39916.1 hypothetical protein [Massilia aquatica]
MSTTTVTSQASFFQAKKSEAIDNETQRWFYDLDNEFFYGASSFWEKSSLVRRSEPCHYGESKGVVNFSIFY